MPFSGIAGSKVRTEHGATKKRGKSVAFIHSICKISHESAGLEEEKIGIKIASATSHVRVVPF